VLAFAAAAPLVAPDQGPWFWTNAEAWAEALVAGGRRAEACTLARDWLQRFPAAGAAQRLATQACRD
jgi:hypothetical protein